MAGPEKTGKCPKGMVYVPGGVVEMAGKSDGQRLKVSVPSLCWDRYILTNPEYSSYEKRKGIKSKTPRSPKGFDGSRQPRVMVNWYEAKACCEARKARLPTEAEWEHAEAEAGQKPGGQVTKKEACSNTRKTRNVGQFLPNEFGLYDMAGNVWQWTSDQNHLRESSRDISRLVEGKVTRGLVSYMCGYNPIWPGKFYRWSYPPALRNNYIGIRCVISPKK